MKQLILALCLLATAPTVACVQVIDMGAGGTIYKVDHLGAKKPFEKKECKQVSLTSRHTKRDGEKLIK